MQMPLVNFQFLYPILVRCKRARMGLICLDVIFHFNFSAVADLVPGHSGGGDVSLRLRADFGSGKRCADWQSGSLRLDFVLRGAALLLMLENLRTNILKSGKRADGSYFSRSAKPVDVARTRQGYTRGDRRSEIDL